MPWRNLGEVLRDLLRRRVDPEEVGVYVPEDDPDDEDDPEDEE